MADFRKRVTACLRKGKLSSADLQHWLDCPYATVWSWVNHSRAPQDVTAGRYEPRLKLLERHITRHNGFPVPLDVGSHKRPAFIQGVRDGLERARGRTS